MARSDSRRQKQLATASSISFRRLAGLTSRAPVPLDYLVALDHDPWSALADLPDGEIVDRPMEGDRIALEDLDEGDDGR